MFVDQLQYRRRREDFGKRRHAKQRVGDGNRLARQQIGETVAILKNHLVAIYRHKHGAGNAAGTHCLGKFAIGKCRDRLGVEPQNRLAGGNGILNWRCGLRLAVEQRKCEHDGNHTAQSPRESLRHSFWNQRCHSDLCAIQEQAKNRKVWSDILKNLTIFQPVGSSLPVDFTPDNYSTFKSIVIFVLSNREMGHPALALLATSRTLA